MGHCKKCYKPKQLCCCPCPIPCMPKYDRFKTLCPPHVSGEWKLSLKTWSPDSEYEMAKCSQIENRTEENPVYLDLKQCSKPNENFVAVEFKSGMLTGKKFIGTFKKTGNDRLPFWELVLACNDRPITLTANFIGDEFCPNRINFTLIKLAFNSSLAQIGAGKGKKVQRPYDHYH